MLKCSGKNTCLRQEYVGLNVIAIVLLVNWFCYSASGQTQSTFEPYSTRTVPQNVKDLWEDVDARKEPLDIHVVKEWTGEGIVCRYVTFRVGHFNGDESRIAAYYTFPEGQKDCPAFVWSHGGGQRAERDRGQYFAKQGYATLDINWGGRELIEGIEENTDWGAVDPTQGPKFYAGALRPSVKLNLQPDDHTLDPVVSPRNGIWFLLAYAGRRGITFLEEQAEVDANRIGFTGYSMGGTITSIVAIDPRLKAVVPMVGGAGFRLSETPGMPPSKIARTFENVMLYNRTIDPYAYWPHVKCPVLFLSASDDFHAKFDQVYLSMGVIPHSNWRISQKMHFNHSLGPQQWVLLNLWFDKYLKGRAFELPTTPRSEIDYDFDTNAAYLYVSPDQVDELERLDIYYSHDPNARARFWISAEATREGDVWKAEMPMRWRLPLFAFANATYKLENSTESLRGKTNNYTITSKEHVYIPFGIMRTLLRVNAEEPEVFDDFENGFQDWAFQPNGGISTYKFQDPRRLDPSPLDKMKIEVTCPRGRLRHQFRIAKNKFLADVDGPEISYSAHKQVGELGEQAIVLRASDFKDREGNVMKDWSNIATFLIQVYDLEAKTMLRFESEENRDLVRKIVWVSPDSEH